MDSPMEDPHVQRLVPYWQGVERLCEEREPVAAVLVVYLPDPDDEDSVTPHVVAHTPTTEKMKVVEASVRRLAAVIQAHLGIAGPRVMIEREPPSKEDDGE